MYKRPQTVSTINRINLLNMISESKDFYIKNPVDNN